MSEEVLDNATDEVAADESTIEVQAEQPESQTDAVVEKPEKETKPGKEPKSEPYWKDDWRQQLAKGDEKYLKQLGRFASPEALADAYRAAQARISSGELKAPLGKDATPEEISAWREENGIPATPDKYEIEGFDVSKLNDTEKERYQGFLESAHSIDLKPEQVKTLVEWQTKYEQQREAAQYEKDQQDKSNVMDKLNAEWGAGYRSNVNAISGLLTTFPESVRESIKGARLSDGSLMFNHPDIMRGFVAVALKDNPAALITPNTGADPMKNIDGRIKEIETLMKTDRKAYNKDEKAQDEYRQLLEARDKLTKRAA